MGSKYSLLIENIFGSFSIEISEARNLFSYFLNPLKFQEHFECVLTTAEPFTLNLLIIIDN